MLLLDLQHQQLPLSLLLGYRLFLKLLEVCLSLSLAIRQLIG